MISGLFNDYTDKSNLFKLIRYRYFSIFADLTYFLLVT